MAKNPLQSILVKIRVGGGVSLHACHAVSESRKLLYSRPVFDNNDPKTIRHARLGTINRKPENTPG